MDPAGDVPNGSPRQPDGGPAEPPQRRTREIHARLVELGPADVAYLSEVPTDRHGADVPELLVVVLETPVEGTSAGPVGPEVRAEVASRAAGLDTVRWPAAARPSRDADIGAPSSWPAHYWLRPWAPCWPWLRWDC